MFFKIVDFPYFSLDLLPKKFYNIEHVGYASGQLGLLVRIAKAVTSHPTYSQQSTQLGTKKGFFEGTELAEKGVSTFYSGQFYISSHF